MDNDVRKFTVVFWPGHEYTGVEAEDESDALHIVLMRERCWAGGTETCSYEGREARSFKAWAWEEK